MEHEIDLELLQSLSNNIGQMSLEQINEVLLLFQAPAQNNEEGLSIDVDNNIENIEINLEELVHYEPTTSPVFLGITEESRFVQYAPAIIYSSPHARNASIRIHPQSENFMPRMRFTRSARRIEE